MKIERTKNAVRNSFYGVMYRGVAMLGPFLVRSVMLYIMGTEYVGLSSLFTSILSFLSLAELGIGNALVYSMYKPIATDDDDTICALLKLYRKLYFYIGIVISVVGLAFIPFLPHMVKGDCPADINLYVLYLIYLLNTVISYLMFGYKQSLLTAFQRSDIISKRSLVMQTLMYIAQIALLYISKNYYLYIICLPIMTFATNIANAVIVDKMFPQYKCRGEVSKELSRSIYKKTFALFGTKANAIVVHAADNLVISAYIGLAMVGIYGNYYYIMNSIIGIMTIIYSSLVAGLGNSLETESEEKNYSNFRTLSLINAWIVGWFTICLLCIYQPFMRIWVGEKLMFDWRMVLLLSLYFYIYQIRRIVLTFKDAAGLWWQDLLRPYVAMITNVVLNLILVQVIGIYGIVISTIVSMIVSVPWENYTVFKYIFHRKSVQFYVRSLVYVLVTVIAAAITYLLCLKVGSVSNNALQLILCILFSAVIPNIVFYAAFCRFSEFKDCVKRIKGIISRKKKRGESQKN